MTAFHFGNVQLGGKLPPHHCFKSRILRLLDFGDEGTFYPIIERLIQLCFLVQGVSKLSTPFKGSGKTPLPYI